MRKKIVHTGPREGDEQVVSGFLLFPKTIGDERRWFEWAKWRKRLTRFHGESSSYLAWEDVEWI